MLILCHLFLSLSHIYQDPVCGSAHCALAPYWSQKLGKCDFVAHAVSLLFFSSESFTETIRIITYYHIDCVVYFAQASPRGGIVKIHLDEQNQRVLLRGKAVTVMEGSLLV